MENNQILTQVLLLDLILRCSYFEFGELYYTRRNSELLNPVHVADGKWGIFHCFLAFCRLNFGFSINSISRLLDNKISVKCSPALEWRLLLLILTRTFLFLLSYFIKIQCWNTFIVMFIVVKVAYFFHHSSTVQWLFVLFFLNYCNSALSF